MPGLRTARKCWRAVIAAFFFAGVQSVSAQTVNVRHSSKKVETRTEEISLSNCEGGYPISQEKTLELSTRQSLKVEAKGSTSAGANLTVHGVTVNVGTEVAKTYGNTFGQEKSERDSVKLVAPPGTDMVFTIEQYEEWASGQLQVTVPYLAVLSRTENYPYKYRTTAGIRIVRSLNRGCHFLGRIPGKYNLVAWRETPGPVTLYVEVLSGTLDIDGTGRATWILNVRRSGTRPSPQPRLVCRGIVQNEQRLAGERGSETTDWDSGLEAVHQQAHLAWCGWTLPRGLRDKPFAISLRDLGGDQRILTITNSAGTFTWRKIQ